MSLDPQTRQAIFDAFHRGELRVQAVDLDTGEVALHAVSDVLKHTRVAHKKALRVRSSLNASGDAGGTQAGFREVVVTEDHSLFRFDSGWLRAIPAGDLQTGQWVAAVTPQGKAGRLWPSQVLEVSEVERHEVMYDLSVPGPQNFVLTNGLLAHNSYSIGGISLDISKASTYESLKQNAEQQFDKATESKQSTVKIIRGLKQPRFGMGVRSAFGPFTGRGTLGPRSFV